MAKTITMDQAVALMIGGRGRFLEQMAKDGATAVIAEISILRGCLDRLESSCQSVIDTGWPDDDDDAIWKATRKAARKLCGPLK